MAPDAAVADATPAADPVTTPATPEPTVTPDATLGAAGEKALAEFKDRARAAEKDLKATKAELAKIQQSSMSDTEKAVAEAEARGRTSALQETGASRVADAVRVAAAGRTVDIDALLEGLDTTRFLDDEFMPDRAAIVAWIDRVSPAPAEPTVDLGPLGLGIDLGQGSQQQNTPIGDNKGLENMLRDVVGLPKV